MRLRTQSRELMGLYPILTTISLYLLILEVVGIAAE